jgi:thioredoxin 1
MRDRAVIDGFVRADMTMIIPEEEKRGPVVEIGPNAAKGSAGGNAAKFSIFAAVVVTGLNVCGFTVRGGASATLTVVGYIAVALMCAGLVAAVMALVRGFSSRSKNVVVLAVVGLLLNGGLLSVGLAGESIPKLLGLGQDKHTVVAHEERRLSSRSGRKIITKNWTGAGMVIELTDSNFDKIVQSSHKPVLVDFWAPWCGPCRRMSPVIEGIAGNYEDKVKVCKLNTDVGRHTAEKFNIRVIPTIMLFKDGCLRQTWTGATSSQTISASIDSLLDE